MAENNVEMRESDRPPLSNARLGILVLLGAETMLFSGLIGTFLVFRVGNVTWPPPSHIGIELPQVVTGINTALLLLSGYTMFQAWRAIQKNRVKQLCNWLLITGLLGAAFPRCAGKRVGTTHSQRTYTPVGCVWRHLLCTHWMPCCSRAKCSYMVVHRPRYGDGRTVLGRPLYRH